MKLNKYIKPNEELTSLQLKSLVKSEIECWGSKPFDEFMVCKNTECKSIYSIEDIYGSIEYYRKLSNNDLGLKIESEYLCEFCGSNLEKMYSFEEYIEELKDFFKKDVSIVLLEDGLNVEGFGMLNRGELRKIINEDMDKRPNSWNIDNVINLISNKYYGGEKIDNNEFIYSNKIYVSPFYRKGDMTLNLLKELFLLKNIFRGLPIIGETKYESKFYGITKLIGYKDLLNDKHGSVFQFTENYTDVLDKIMSLKSFADKGAIREIIKYKRKSNTIIKEKGFNNRKKYA